MKLAVIGLGHVGLVTAVCFAEKGFKVFGMDKDKEKIKKLRNKEIPFFEPGLKELLIKNFDRLEFTDSIELVTESCEVIFLCVGTPSLPDGRADLSQVEDVSREIAKNLNRFTLIVEKSTVPVKTAEWIKRIMSLYVKKNVTYEVASNPEFLREGSAVRDFLEPDRIVVGVESERGKKIFEKIYEDFDAPIIFTDIETSEIIKHASNAFLATKISFINMISDLCEKTGADILKVSEAMGLDKRIGREFLNAGVGYGGSCFPKDVKAFYKIGEELGLDFSLLKCVDKINESRIDKFIEKIKKVLWIIKDKTFAIWGLSFKPGTDDVREAPSIKIAKRILEEKGICRVYDPYAIENFKKEFVNSDRIYYSKDPYDAVKGANAILIVTEWDEFKNLDFKKIKELMETPIIIDGRNCLDMNKMCELNFIYVPTGRKICGF
ncbi:MAG: UDP-glucose/GDP-mannose dehydrogenase family protein [Candidatus Hydrothermales bacterium]